MYSRKLGDVISGLVLFLADTMVMTGYYSLLALSLNFEYGYTGLIDFGKAAFFALGAYAYAMTVISGGSYELGLAAAMIVAAMGGLAISLPAIRVRGDYLAIITLVFAESLRLVFKNEDWLAGGILGIRGIPSLISVEGMPYLIYLFVQAAIAFTIFGIFAYISWRPVNSPFGRIMRAVREDELAANVYGKNTVTTKAIVFAMSSAIAGAAGAFYSQYVGYVSPDLFILAITLQIWIMSILGGPASISGSVAGALMFIAIDRGLRILKDFLALPVDPNNMMFILTGLILMLVIIFKPEGLVKEGRIKTA